MSYVGQFIAGQIDGSRDQNTLTDIYDSAQGRVIRQVIWANQEQVHRALASATAAFAGWAGTSPLRRAAILFEFRQRLLAAEEDLVRLIGEEHGKIGHDAQGELRRGLDVVDFACGIPHLLKGRFSSQISRGIDVHDFREPLGTVVGITPFNFPIMVPLWMFPIAIACGNCFILKASEQVPSAALRMAQLLTEAGLPSGVFQVLQGGASVSQSLVDAPSVRAVSFVGSTPIAQSVFLRASSNFKRVQALGGAKNHLIVMPDADPSRAVDALTSAAFGAAGQRCMAISVGVIVGEQKTLIERIAVRSRNLTLGAWNNKEADLGPLISPQHFKRVLAAIDKGVAEGAQLVVDGRNVSVEGFPRGFFVGPTVFSNVRTDMTIYTDEIFGPVLCLVAVQSLDEAIALLNKQEFGNGAAIMTNDGAVARKFAREAPAGMIGINVPIPVPPAFHSFGGWKHSLFGESHVHGEEGVNFYTKIKTITSRWDHEPSQAGLSMPVHG